MKQIQGCANPFCLCRPDTLVQHYLRPEEMKPFYMQVWFDCWQLEIPTYLYSTVDMNVACHRY